ncbi:MAG: hypothetical protein FWD06_09555 [Oscillospiraceae bacterium]|nr:hypothetical protein [Oscillospiraceae bacterium]
MTIDNWTEVLAPVVGIVLAAITASLSYFFAKRSQLRADERRLKEKCYLEYIGALSNNVLSDNIEDARSKLSDAHNHILLIGNSDVVANLRKFSRLIGCDNTNGFTREEHDETLTSLLKSMRQDLYKNRKINDNYPVVSLNGKHRRDRKETPSN